MNIKMYIKSTIDECEEIIFDNDDLIMIGDEVIYQDDSEAIVVDGYCIYIPELDLNVRQGTVNIYDDKEDEFYPDFCISVVYDQLDDGGKWLYWEQGDICSTLANFMRGQYSYMDIMPMECEILVPDDFNVDEAK